MKKVKKRKWHKPQLSLLSLFKTSNSAFGTGEDGAVYTQASS
ncbi:MAG: hypothetical protein ACLFUC_07735 [Bacteroidales bacterium]